MPHVIGIFLGLALGLATLYLVFKAFFRVREVRPSGRRARRRPDLGKRRRTLRRPRTY